MIGSAAVGGPVALLSDRDRAGDRGLRARARTAGVAPAPAMAFAAAVTFGTPTASVDLRQGDRLHRPVTAVRGLDRVELLLTSPGALGPNVTVDVPPPSGAGAQTLHYALDLAGGHILPNTTIDALSGG